MGLARITAGRRRLPIVAIGLLGLFLASVTFAADSDHVIDEIEIDDFDRDHWSYRPIADPPLPEVSQRSWPRNGVRSFHPGVAGSPSHYARRVRLTEPPCFGAFTSTCWAPRRRHAWSKISLPTIDPTPIRGWSIGCSLHPNTANDGDSTGLTWRGLPRPTASNTTSFVRPHGSTATGSSTRSTPICRTMNLCRCRSPATPCTRTIRPRKSPPPFACPAPTCPTSIRKRNGNMC